MRITDAIVALAFVACGALVPACSCGATPGDAPECLGGTDLDGDHYGPNCPGGPDCNDHDPAIHNDCCSAGIFEGCPCDPAIDTTSVPCFDGPPALAGVGSCTKGLRECNTTTSTWGLCVGQIVPSDEVCNAADDDCDNSTDEGVMSTCGNCLPGCSVSGVDTDPFPCMEQNPAIHCDGVGVNPMGDIIIDSSTIENHFLWIANDHDGTVSKLDTRTGYEVGRYPTVTHARVVNHTGRNFPLYNDGTAGNQYALNRPSRTAVDFYGDVWVANRAPDQQPSITKIFNAPVDCIDANSNGMIETSHDVDGDHRIDPANPAEFFGETDECIAMTVVVGDVNSWQARALAIDAGMRVEGQRNPGNVWVGMFTEQAFYQIDGTTGAILQRVPQTGTLQDVLGVAINPYGAAIDGMGRLWAPSTCCGAVTLARIDTGVNPSTIGRSTLTSPGGSYGIAVDLMNRVWLGGYPVNSAFRYDPATDTWATASIPMAPGWGVRGVGLDTRGNIWGALHITSPAFSASRLVRIDANTATATGMWDMPGQEVPVGAGVDFDGDVWAVNQSSSTASRLHIDQITGEPAPHPTTGNTVDSFPVGQNPYTYSDFTGLGLRTVTNPSGDYIVPIQGCTSGRPAHWVNVSWTQTTPPGTHVQVYVRAGNDLATLDQQPQFGPWTVSPADLQLPPGPVPDSKYLLLTIRLLSDDRESTPIVHSYNVQWSCDDAPPG
jgi:streptogramin lyase